jgi:hypothetical protein
VSALTLAYEQYRTPRGYEWMMRVGDPRTPPVLIVPPLFEELNRTRALIAGLMRRLAVDGHGCWLPDLGGTSESVTPLEQVGWPDWCEDIAAAADHIEEASGKAPLIASIRGGCLVDHDASGHCWWRFAPVAGASLVRDMERASLAGGAEFAGYPASPELKAGIGGATAAPIANLRTLRLATDAAEADWKVEGPALWRRSEPGNSPELVEILSKDIAEWRRSCAAS